MTRKDKWKGRRKRLANAAGLLAIVLALVSLVSACGLTGNAGSAKAHMGVPIDVQGNVTPSGGEGTVIGKDTGQPLVSGGFAIYWPNVLAEAVAWFQRAVPDFATTLLGGNKPATAPAAVSPSSRRDDPTNKVAATTPIEDQRCALAILRGHRTQFRV